VFKLFRTVSEGVFSETAGLLAYGVLACSGHHGGIIRGPGLAVRKKFLYGTRSIKVAKSTVCHYGLECHSHDTQLLVDKRVLLIR
jgi:hypothetical protein